MSSRAHKARIILVSLRERKKSWKEAEHWTHVEDQQKDIDLKDPTPLINDHQAIR